MAAAAVTPQCQNAPYLGRNRIRQPGHGQSCDQIHGPGFRQRSKARVHLGRCGAGERAGRLWSGPQLGFGVDLGEIFKDGQAVPDRKLADEQCGHASRGGIAQDVGLRVGPVQLDLDLLEGDATLAHGEPGPQAPARNVLVADHQPVAHVRLVAHVPFLVAAHRCQMNPWLTSRRATQLCSAMLGLLSYEGRNKPQPMKKRVAVLISGRGSNMMALVEAARASEYPAEVALVISNRPEAVGLQRAKDARIKALAIDHKAYATRDAFDAAVE